MVKLGPTLQIATTIEDPDHLRRCRKLLNNDPWVHTKIPEIRRVLDIKTRNRTESLVADWRSLRGQIPNAFLRMIGVTHAMLLLAFQEDHAEYRAKLSRRETIEQLLCKIMPCVFLKTEPPYPNDQIEANLECLKTESLRHPGRVYLVRTKSNTRSYRIKEGLVTIHSHEPKSDFTMIM
jgi:hypothetical protein